MTLQELTTLLGWCTVINFGLLTFIALCLFAMRGWVKGIHSSMYGVPADQLEVIYFNYMANYKLLIFIFNLVPWAALKIMA